MSARVFPSPPRLEAQPAAALPIEKRLGPWQVFSGLLTGNASLLAWLMILGFGGALLVLYYSHIHYFPELEWKESLTYLIALSLLGGTVAVLYGLLLFVPGVIWSEFLKHDSELEDKPAGQLELCFLQVALHVALPFLGFMGVMHFAALTRHFWTIATPAVVVLALISVYLSWRFQVHIEKKDKADKGFLLLKYVGLFNVSALISLASLLFLFDIVSSDKLLRAMFPICTMVVVASNLLVAAQFHHRLSGAVVTAILATLILLGCGEMFGGPDGALSSRLMARFGIGVDEVTLVAKEEAKGIFESHGVDVEPVRSGTVTIREARILSRLGKEYFVEAGTRRVAIPQDLILSWSIAKDGGGSTDSGGH
jgi:hypothetical protein